MTIQEAIRQRIERFNRLWVKAVGYSFEDEVKIMEKERDDAVNKANERAKEIGYSDYQEYIEKLNSFYKYDETMGYQLSDEVSYNKTKDNVLDELIKNIPTVNPLYFYEMSVLNEVEKIINFLLFHLVVPNILSLIFARPKSLSFICPVLSMRTLSGFISLCIQSNL